MSDRLELDLSELRRGWAERRARTVEAIRRIDPRGMTSLQVDQEMSRLPRVVFDTNVVLSALVFSKGRPPSPFSIGFFSYRRRRSVFKLRIRSRLVRSIRFLVLLCGMA